MCINEDSAKIFLEINLSISQVLHKTPKSSKKFNLRIIRLGISLELTYFEIIVLIATGLLAGSINTIAGGGSNLSLPILMFLGLPADIANGTNRVAVMLQCIVGLKGYDEHGALHRAAIFPILVPTCLGGLIGATLSTAIPNLYLKPILLLLIFVMAVTVLFRPDIMAPELGSIPKNPNKTPKAWCSLFLAGVYGGFAQAGVGFILLAALTVGLKYDLIRANALKTLCALAFTSIALCIFIAFGMVSWIPGLILGTGSMVGAHFTVRQAVKAKPSTVRWALFGITSAAVAVGLLF